MRYNRRKKNSQKTTPSRKRRNMSATPASDSALADLSTATSNNSNKKSKNNTSKKNRTLKTSQRRSIAKQQRRSVAKKGTPKSGAPTPKRAAQREAEQEAGVGNNKNSDVSLLFFGQEESKNLILKLLGDDSNEGTLSEPICCEKEANTLQDLDLIILGAPAEDYKHYTQLLRREYSHMNDDHYNLMRLKVLQTLLKIPTIYSTPEYQEKYEAKARTNIKREIGELKAE